MSKSHDEAPSDGIRLQKVMADAGVASRRASEDLIRRGRVRVNGRVVTELGTKVRPGVDTIEVNGRPMQLSSGRTYILLNKPRSFVTTVNDPRGRRTVLDLIDGVRGRLFPVGRLDYDTEGLLLLTNDGELTYALTHPKHGVPRTYLAEVEGTVSPETATRLANGIELDDGPTRPAEVRILGHEDGNTKLTVTLTEGRNRQVRRMLAAVGHPVLFLKRVQFGPLSVHGVKLGQWRSLTQAEVAKLYAAAGLKGKAPAHIHEPAAARSGATARRPLRRTATPVKGTGQGRVQNRDQGRAKARVRGPRKAR